MSTTVAAGVSLSRGASRTLWFSRPAPGARRIYPRDRVVANVKTRPAARAQTTRLSNTQINNSRNRPWDRQVKMARRATGARSGKMEKTRKMRTTSEREPGGSEFRRPALRTAARTRGALRAFADPSRSQPSTRSFRRVASRIMTAFSDASPAAVLGGTGAASSAPASAPPRARRW